MVILVIIQANVMDSNGFVLSNFKGNSLSVTRSHKSIEIKVTEDDILVYISVEARCEAGNLIESAKCLQQRICEEILHLTGLIINNVNIRITHMLNE